MSTSIQGDGPMAILASLKVFGKPSNSMDIEHDGQTDGPGCYKSFSTDPLSNDFSHHSNKVPKRSFVDEKFDNNFMSEQTEESNSSGKHFISDLSSKRYTLVLDLDETLVHFKNEGGKPKFLIRPHAYNFLKNMSAFFEVIVFTAAQKEYADWILDKIDTKKSISHRLYRDHCVMSKTSHLKVD